MRVWSKIKAFFSVRPPSQHPGGGFGMESAASWVEQRKSDTLRYASEKVLFDNKARFAVSTVMLAVCFVLWIGGVIAHVSPFVVLFFVYGGAVVASGVGLKKSWHPREIDISLATFDMIAISTAVLWTGGRTSPFYFVYFIPLIIQAFHRDWVLILHYGFGGVMMYAAAAALAVGTWTSPEMTDFGARLFMMLMTVLVAVIAVNLLRKKDEEQQRRLSRMRMLNGVSELLHRVASPEELQVTVQELVKYLNDELGPQISGWCRIFLVENNGHFMHALADPANNRPELKKELPVEACPVMRLGGVFEMKDNQKELGCPAESFSFRSHVCLPVAGADGVSLGVVFCGSEQTNAFGKEEHQFLQFVGKSLGLTVQRLKKIEELNLTATMDSCALATFLGSTRSLEATLSSIVDGTLSIVGADQVSVMLWEPLLGALMTKCVVGPYAEGERRAVLKMGEGIAGQVLELGEAQCSTDLKSDPVWLETRSPFRSLLCVPLKTIKGEPMGVLSAWSLTGGRAFSTIEIDTASTYAARAAIAIENAFFHEQERELIAALRHSDPIFKVA